MNTPSWPDLEAWLEKKSPKTSFSWQKRWWTLKNGEVVYYKKPKGTQKGAFPCIVISKIDGEGSKIKLTIGSRVWKLRAHNARDAEKWREGLRKSIKIWHEQGRGEVVVPEGEKWWKGMGASNFSRDRSSRRSSFGQEDDSETSSYERKASSTRSRSESINSNNAGVRGGWTTAGKGFEAAAAENKVHSGLERTHRCHSVAHNEEDELFDGKVPYLEGYLNKQFAQGLLSTVGWHKRWFVLNDTRIYHYRSADGSHLIGCIQSDQITRIEISQVGLHISAGITSGTVLSVEVNGVNTMHLMGDTRDVTIKWAKGMLKSHIRAGGSNITEITGLPKSTSSRVVRHADKLSDEDKVAIVRDKFDSTEKEAKKLSLADDTDPASLAHAIRQCDLFLNELWAMLDDISLAVPPRRDVAEFYSIQFSEYLHMIMAPFLSRPHFPLRQLYFLVDWIESIEDRIYKATRTEILPKLSYTPSWDEVTERIAPKLYDWALMPKETTGVLSSSVGIATKAMTKSISIATLGVADKAMEKAVGKGDIGSWKRRYFVLKNRYLKYFKAKNGLEPVHSGEEAPSDIIDLKLLRDVKRLLAKPMQVKLTIQNEAYEAEIISFKPDVMDLVQRIKEQKEMLPSRHEEIKGCFFGADLIDFLCDNQIFDSRVEALVLCETLADERAIRPLKECSGFRDDDITMYRFYWEDEEENQKKSMWQLTIKFETEDTALQWAQALKTYQQQANISGDEVAFADLGPQIPTAVLEYDKSKSEFEDAIQSKYISEFTSGGGAIEILDELLSAADKFISELFRYLDEIIYYSTFRQDVYDFVLEEYYTRMYQVIANYTRNNQMTWDGAETIQLLVWLNGFHEKMDPFFEHGSPEVVAKCKPLRSIPEVPVFITDYVEWVTRVIKDMYKNIIIQELTNPSIQKDEDGQLFTMAAVDTFQIFDQQLALVLATKNEDLTGQVAAACLNSILTYQDMLLEAIGQNISSLSLEVVCALSNNCPRSVHHTAAMTDKLRDTLNAESFEKLPFESVESAFNRNGKKCVAFVTDVIWRDLRDLLSNLFCARWYEEDIMAVIIATLNDYYDDVQVYLEAQLFRKVTSDSLDRLADSYIEELVAKKNKPDERLPDKTDDDVLHMQNFYLQHMKKNIVDGKLRILRDVLELLVCDVEMIPMYSSSLVQATDIQPGVFNRIFELRTDLDKKQLKAAMQIVFNAFPDVSDDEDCSGARSPGKDKKRRIFARMNVPVVVDPIKEKARQQREKEKKEKEEREKLLEMQKMKEAEQQLAEQQKIKAMSHRRAGVVNIDFADNNNPPNSNSPNNNSNNNNDGLPKKSSFNNGNPSPSLISLTSSTSSTASTTSINNNNSNGGNGYHHQTSESERLPPPVFSLDDLDCSTPDRRLSDASQASGISSITLSLADTKLSQGFSALRDKLKLKKLGGGK